MKGPEPYQAEVADVAREASIRLAYAIADCKKHKNADWLNSDILGILECFLARIDEDELRQKFREAFSLVEGMRRP